jgi:hypothetical protein
LRTRRARLQEKRWDTEEEEGQREKSITCSSWFVNRDDLSGRRAEEEEREEQEHGSDNSPNHNSRLNFKNTKNFKMKGPILALCFLVAVLGDDIPVFKQPYFFPSCGHTCVNELCVETVYHPKVFFSLLPRRPPP